MSRVSRAAKTLAAEVTALKPDAEIEMVGEPDGFGVVRSIKFDEITSAWLAPLLVELADKRVVEHHVTEAGYLHVELTGSLARGEDRSPFHLAAAQEVVEAGTSEPEPVQAEETAAPKATAKKAATKKAVAKKATAK